MLLCSDNSCCEWNRASRFPSHPHLIALNLYCKQRGTNPRPPLPLAVQKISILKKVRHLDAVVGGFFEGANMNREALFMAGNGGLLTADSGATINN